MKAFACGDLVPGCQAEWVCSTDEEVLAEAARHARVVQRMTEIPPALVEQVRARIVPVA